MGFQTSLQRFDGDLWHFYIPVSADYTAEYVLGTDRRVYCRINDTLEIQCALMPDGTGNYVINLNKEVRTKLKLKENDELSISLRKDTSEYGMEMPEEFAEVLRQMPDAQAWFKELTPGKQRNLIYIVLKVKSSEIRVHKPITIAEHLVKNNGAINFRGLNDDFKAANRH